MWLDCWPTAASPICLRLYHPISQAAGGNWVHCSHRRISWIESFIIWITMNVNEPHICTWVMGENISLPTLTATYSTSLNTFTALGLCFASCLEMPHVCKHVTFPQCDIAWSVFFNFITNAGINCYRRGQPEICPIDVCELRHSINHAPRIFGACRLVATM